MPGAARRLGTFFWVAKRKYPKKRPPQSTAAVAASLRASVGSGVRQQHVPVLWRTRGIPAAPLRALSSPPSVLGLTKGKKKTTKHSGFFGFVESRRRSRVAQLQEESARRKPARAHLAMDGLLGEPECNEQRRVVALATQPPGGLLFGYFFLATQEKVPRLSGARPRLKSSPRRRFKTLTPTSYDLWV